MDSRNRQIVLLGESGTGKSASGNTILMKNAFHSEKSTREVTSECERGTAEINGRHVTVIDTPGLSDIKLENEEIQKKIKHFISDLSTPHVYLLLIKVGEYPKNAEKLVKFIQDTFGGNAMENAIVLFTGGDHLGKKTIEEYILKPKSKIRQIISQFGGRYHVFDNKNQVPLQVSDLLEKIDKMDAENTTMRGACTVKEARKNEGVLKRFAHQMQIKKKPYDSNNSQSKHYKQNKFKKSESEGDEKVTMHMSASKKKIDDVSSTRRHFSVQQNQKKTKVQEKSKNKLHEENKSVKVKNNNERQNEREDYLTEQKCIQMNEGRKVQPTAKPTYTSQATKPKSKTNTAEDKKQDNRLENQRKLCEIGQNNTKPLEGREVQPAIPTYTSQATKSEGDSKTAEDKKQDNRLENQSKLCEIGQNNTKPLEGREVQPAIPTYTSQATKSEGDSKTAEDKKQDNRLENQSKLCEIGQNNTKPLEGREVQPTIPTYTSQATKSEGDSKTAEDKKQDNRLENQRELCEIKPHEGKNDRQTITYTSQEIKQPKPEGKNKTKMEKQKYKYISIEQKDRHTSIQSEKPTEKIEDLTTKKLKMSDILHISKHSLQYQEPQDKDELIICFIQKLIRINYTARYIQQKENNEDCPMDKKIHAINTTNYKKKEQSEANFNSHPMDVQMTVFHCADGFLKQLMLTKLSECQYALPLLVPIHSQKQIEFPLWAFRKITKSWKIKCTNNEIVSKSQPMYKAETPMVAFFRFGSLSTSKSQLMNSLINERHNTFFHRNCTGSSRTRVLMDGVVEIAWYCPSGKDTDKFTDCVAFCNLHGDAGDHEDQLNILTEMASVNVVLLPQLDRDDINAAKIQKIYKNSTTVICLLSESNSAFTVMRKGKFKIGLKDRNQSEVIDELRGAINDGLSHISAGSHSIFRLEDMARCSDIKVDKDDDNACKMGKQKAQQMVSLLEKRDLTEIKDSFLPCQGKLWHQWCQKNKELHQLRGDKIEIDISKKQSELEAIRKQQHESDTSEFMSLFLKEMNSQNADEKIYFLKWLEILLDECTSENLSDLHLQYQIKCLKILKLKENHYKSQELTTEQQKLKEISTSLQAATFGLENILREIGQIYESCSSVNKSKKDLQFHYSSLPSLAAEMMVSGFPLELMDGDAAHVPLIWVTAVLDELINKLGDVRIFVLSVLGIQSSGKSTLLNTMFGLQFAVSAGRCTRGAFMQLVKVSKDMNLKFDYILVVDTEGLCSPELSGRETRHHDNELATFVAGIGNLTLINIFGESAAEIHNILQIVVQALLRMKLVKLNPSCIFVHQNISDAAAEEKNIEGKRTLQEELDKMTKLAAKDEGCDVQCFKDVIKFNIQNDVKYMAQLWEGTPPMAPPCPDYSDGINDLKQTIISHASQSDSMTLTHLKEHIKDLWKALLHERFVFSFKNSLEVANYRKLETEYSKWSWNFESFMREIEHKLLNKIENGAIHEITDADFKGELKEKSEEINKDMIEFLKKNKNTSLLNQWKAFEIKLNEFQESTVEESKRKLNQVLQQRHMKEKIHAQRGHTENILFEKSKNLALKLKDRVKDERNLKENFDHCWKEWVDDIMKDTPAVKSIDISNDIDQLLTDMNAGEGYLNQKSACNDISSVADFSYYISFRPHKRGINNPLIGDENHQQIKHLLNVILEETEKMIKSYKIAELGYNILYMHKLTDYIKRRVKEHEEQVTYIFKKEFTLDLTLHICRKVHKIFTDQQRIFLEANNPAFYFERKRGEYFNIFMKYSHGAKSTAIFGEFICNKLKEPIEESAYKKTAKELADEMKTNCEPFNGNRSKLEKHILEALAEKENFTMYMTYIHNPREHFKTFIRDEVSKYISEKFRVSILPKINKHIELQKQKIIEAAQEASEEVKEKSGDVDLWLKTFTHKLSGVLIFSEKSFTGVSRDDVDVKLLEDVVRRTLSAAMPSMNNELIPEYFLGKLDYKDKPDDILIKHFCKCCWVQCPFCKTICTNTIENHTGDHSVPFHRNIGLSGWHYRGTKNLNINICTSEVATNHCFYPNGSADIEIPWREYRRAGPNYANWSITPDFTVLPYWKWFVQKFRNDLEKYFDKTLQESNIPKEWKKCTKQKAIESLKEYYL